MVKALLKNYFLELVEKYRISLLVEVQEAILGIDVTDYFAVLAKEAFRSFAIIRSGRFVRKRGVLSDKVLLMLKYK